MRTMTKNVKHPKAPGIIKNFFASNLLHLMEERYYYLETRTERAETLSRDSGVGKNTIIRACDPNDPTSLSLDKLERLANALKVAPYQLLVPYLDAKDPQSVISHPRNKKPLKSA